MIKKSNLAFCNKTGVETFFNEELGVVLPEPVTAEPVTNSTCLHMLISTDQKMILIS